MGEWRQSSAPNQPSLLLCVSTTIYPSRGDATLSVLAPSIPFPPPPSPLPHPPPPTHPIHPTPQVPLDPSETASADIELLAMEGGEGPSSRPVAPLADDDKGVPGESSFCAQLITFFSYVLVVLTFPFSLAACIKVVQEYERAIIFRLGRLLSGGAKGPGLFFILPCIDTYRKVDLRTVSYDVPPQEILSKDSVTVKVDAVVYFRINNATVSITNVENAAMSTKLLAATTLRNILGTRTLHDMLADREQISNKMLLALDEATDPWGVKVERVEMKDVRLPKELQRAMAAEAEATRESAAKIIAAEGEQRAASALKEAALVMSESPAAIQLRYLQTLNSISAEKNTTIIFPFPVDLLQGWGGKN